MSERERDEKELQASVDAAFKKWWPTVQTVDLGEDAECWLEGIARLAWKSAIDWAEGKTIVGGVEDGKGVQIVAYIKTRALAPDGQYFSTTVVASNVNDEGRLSLDMPTLLVTGCGENIVKLLSKMGYVKDSITGQMVKPEAGPEGKVM